MNKPVEPQLSATQTMPLPTAVVGSSLPHESAHLHVQGRAPYTDDLPELAGTLHAALGLSPLAHGVIEAIDLQRIRALPGVVDMFTAKDILVSTTAVPWCTTTPSWPARPATRCATAASRCSPWWPPRATPPAVRQRWPAR